MHMTTSGVTRMTALNNWVAQHLPHPFTLKLLAGDASFRRYFRATTAANQTYIIMDAPPQKESCHAFVQIAQQFKTAHLQVPDIYHQDIAQGFLCLTDFGDVQMAHRLQTSSADTLYRGALQQLIKLHSHSTIQEKLPHFGAQRFSNEFELFENWYLKHHLRHNPTEQEQSFLKLLLEKLERNADEQPQVPIHSDYHSRNLMVCNDNTLGILDFQDASVGPITYDALSLLRDCYVDWPPQQVDQWMQYFHQLCLDARMAGTKDPAQWQRWFDYTGLHRNLKCIGIFSRLAWRDHKISYLDYIPRVIKYAQAVCHRYTELQPLLPLLAIKRHPS